MYAGRTRLAPILLELSGNFGVQNKRGTRLTVPARHKEFADPVGASRSSVTEFLIQFERDHFIIRDERHLIVRRERLESFFNQTPSEQQSSINFLTFPPVKLAFCGQLAPSELSDGDLSRVVKPPLLLLFR
jgi:hypothetical protein